MSRTEQEQGRKVANTGGIGHAKDRSIVVCEKSPQVILSEGILVLSKKIRTKI